MKPTDEAKRLRDEIVLTISNSEPFTSEYFDDFDYKLIGSIAEKSINKVLDAVEDRISNYGKSFNEVIHLDGVIEDIDKLRQKP